MMKNKSYIFSLLSLYAVAAMAQPPAKSPLKKSRFFTEDSLIVMDLSTDLKKLTIEKKVDVYQPATATLHLPDSTVITEKIRLSARGEFRRKNCYVPTMRLDFKDTSSPKLSPLGKLKLVCGCDTHTGDEKLILKEFLVYKIYNLLTDMSFRVRLLRINYTDTRGKLKPYSQYGFLIEDVDDMAKRNKCYEVEKKVFQTERTDREQMTLVAIFQFMIGNTDWSVPNYHNIKLMRPETDSVSLPYTIPYDFDFCGIVDASYASPNEDLGIKSVTDRLYRGFPRTKEELQRTLKVFRDKKEQIQKLIQGFELLDQRNRKDVLKFVNEFYEIIEDKYLVEKYFISDARNN